MRSNRSLWLLGQSKAALLPAPVRGVMFQNKVVPMTKTDLAKTLHDMYFNSIEGEAVAMIHLFGIKYAAEIRAADVTFKELAKLAKLQPSYATEISKGAKLAKYVRSL